MPQDIIQQQTRYTAQSAVKRDDVVGVGFLYWMAQAGEILAPWWSKTRDQQLRNKWKESDHFAGAVWSIGAKMASVPFRVEPRDMSVKSHQKQADYFNALLQEGVQFGGGWERFWTRCFVDLWTQDNGFFAEVIGAGKQDGPIRGPVTGMAHLDAWRCDRTSNPEFPVIYTDRDGKHYKFHHSRVMFASQIPSPAAEMNSVGLCWLSRCIDTIQNLIDIATYKQEKLGSRPLRGIIKAPGLKAEQVIKALRMAEDSMDGQGLSRFSKLAVIGFDDPSADLEMMDFASLPDGFDERTATELGMYTVALAGGFPPRWLWPATTTGATKADAMYQHVAGVGGGAAWHLKMMQRLLGGTDTGERHLLGKVLPPQLKLTFDYQDDEQDRLQSDIRDIRSKTRARNLNNGITDLRTAREQALSDGDVSNAQFDELELKDGRLPDGDDVLILFYSKDDAVQAFLALGVTDPLDVEANDSEAMLVDIDAAILFATKEMVIASSGRVKRVARQAVAALEQLKKLYGGEVIDDDPEPSPPPGTEPFGVQGDEEMDEDEDEDEEGEKGRPFELKAINQYRDRIRTAVRAFWNGTTSFDGFVDMMMGAIDRSLTDAWREGAAECGLAMDELSAEERMELKVMIFGQFNYIGGFAESIEQGSKANGGKLGPLFARAEMWINRYNEAKTRSASLACANKKKKWTLGPTEHCRTCAGLNGRVYRYERWAENALPQSPILECTGINCQCSLVDTDERITPGKFPRRLLGQG